MAGKARSRERTAGEDYSLSDALTLRGLLLHGLVNGNTLRAWQNIHISAASGLRFGPVLALVAVSDFSFPR
jgi:hypothetical protein